jgi:MFS family permease
MAEARARRIDLWHLTGGRALLQKEGFRRLLLTRVLAQLGQNAIFYALFVLVAQKTNASIYTGVLVIAFAVPSATLGPLSGVVVDRFSRGWLLVVMNGLRVLMCLALVTSDQSVWILYVFSLLLSASMQFVTPAESAALAQVVEQDELTGANSLFNLGALVGQAGGMAIIAPIFLKTVGASPLFILAGGLFAGAAVIIATVPRLGTAYAPRYPSSAGVRIQFARAWRTLRGDDQAYMALIMAVVGSASLLVGITLLPRYAKSILDVSTENLIFVFSPAAIGLFLGLRLVGRLERFLGKGRTVSLGFALLTLSLLSFGLVGKLGTFLTDQNPLGVFDPGPFDERSGRIIVTMVTAVVAGFAYSLIGVASRALINERIAGEMQGRVFAALTVLSNLASIVPLLLAGALADWLGVQPVLVTVAALMALFVIWTAWRVRFASPGGAYG